MRRVGVAAALVCCCLLISVASEESTKPRKNKRYTGHVSISSINILLPRCDAHAPAAYTLSAFGSCFKWESSNPRDVSVVPLYPDPAKPECSTSASVVAVSDNDARTQAWVIASDVKGAHQPLMCEAFVDRIARIEILTTTRLMYRDETEKIEVQAFDSEGNVFNTLEGLLFKWDIITLGIDDGGGIHETDGTDTVLEMGHFRDTAVETTSITRTLEDRGLTSMAVLIGAVHTGKAKVRVTLMEKGYEADALSSEIVVTVLEPLRLNPFLPTYLLPAGEMQYTLNTRIDHEFVEIPMPNPRYRWYAEDTAVAHVNADTGYVVGLKPGVTQITVEDRVMAANKESAVLYVVPPAYIELRMYPSLPTAALRPPSNWVVVVDREYEVVVSVYDSDDHAVFLSSNLDFDTVIDASHLTTLSASDNKATIVVHTDSIGLAPITSALTSVYSPVVDLTYEPPAPITTRQEAIITLAVTVAPKPLVLLPWDAGTPHEYTLTAVGGTGVFVWEEESASVVSVSAKGVVSAHGLGSTPVTVADDANSLNSDATTLTVAPAAEMRFAPSRVEAEIGDVLELPIVLYDAEGRAFDNCSAVAVTFAVLDPAIFSIGNVTAAPPGTHTCLVLRAAAQREGQTKVRARYANLRAEVTVVAYTPLTVSDKVVRVSLGSAWTVRFSGGPLPWLSDPTLRIESVSAANNDVVTINRVRGGGKGETSSSRAYTITCTQLAEQTITVEVGNKASDDNRSPALSTASLQFICAPVDSLAVFPPHRDLVDESACANAVAFPARHETDDDDDVASAHTSTFSYYLLNNRTAALTVVARDRGGAAFDNFTSVALEWVTSNDSRLRVLPVEAHAAAHVRRTHSRRVALIDEESLVRVKVTAAAYVKSILTAAGVVGDTRFPFAVQAQVDLYLLPNVQLYPRSLLVFNHPNNRASLATRGGSRVLRFSSNATSFAELEFSPGATHVDIAPLSAGVVEITAHDLCLDASAPAVGLVRVANVAAIRLRATNKLQVGADAVLDVEAVDVYGERFDVSQYTLMQLESSVDAPSVLSLSPRNDTPSQFVLKGLSEGVATIVVVGQAGGDGGRVSSEPLVVHVFPAMHIEPASVHVVCGAVFGVGVVGGPPNKVDLQFTTDDSSVAVISDSHSGVVRGVTVGSTLLRARARGYDPHFHTERTYAEDAIDVVVGDLTSVRIVAATTTLTVGGEINIHVEGLDGATPLSMGEADITFSWESSDANVAALRSVYASSGVDNDEGDAVVHLVARSPGTAAVKVTVHTRLPCSSPKTLEASLVISVVEPLSLIFPPKCEPTLIVPPNSRACIVTNKDKAERLHYSVLSSSSSSRSHEAETPITVDASGCVFSRENTANAHVVVSRSGPSGREEVVVSVRVRPVDSVALRPTSRTAYELPIGTQMFLTAELRDEEGRLFSTTHNVALKLTANRRSGDIIRIDTGASEGEYAITAVHQGETVLQLSVSGLESQVSSYATLRVGHAITPAAPHVHVGGVINFRPARDGGGNVQWASAADAVVSVNSETGEARANSIGQTTVYCTKESGERTYTQVDVVRVASVNLLTQRTRQLTNMPGGERTAIPLAFLEESGAVLFPHPSHYHNSHRNNGGSDPINHNIVFECMVVESEWASAEAGALHDGSPACVVTTNPTKADGSSEIVNALTLIVRAGDEHHTYQVYHEASIPFSPSFVVDASSVVIGQRGRAQFSVYGSANVSSSDTNAVRVSKLPPVAPSASLRYPPHLYEVALTGAGASGEVFVVVSNAVTGQTARIPVTLPKPSDDTPVVTPSPPSEPVPAPPPVVTPPTPTDEPIREVEETTSGGIPWWVWVIVGVVLFVGSRCLVGRSRKPLIGAFTPVSRSNRGGALQTPVGDRRMLRNEIYDPGFDHSPASPFTPRTGLRRRGL